MSEIEKTAGNRGTYGRKRAALAAGALILLAALGVAGVRYFGIGSWSHAEKAGFAETGEVSKLRLAPMFTLPDGSGKQRSLEDFRGKVVLLHFWATWCPPCLTEMPEVLEMAKTFVGTDLRVVAVSLDDSWTEAHRILPENVLPANFISLLDLPRETPDRYGSYQYPETYLLNRDLRIVHKFVGAQEWNGKEMVELFKKLL